MKYVALLFFVALLTGCDDSDTQGKRYAERLSRVVGYTNVRYSDRGYVMYEIQNGTVECRDHHQRDELACWKK